MVSFVNEWDRVFVLTTSFFLELWQGFQTAI
jgi:hypothetical protein